MQSKTYNYWRSTRELELNLIGQVWNFRIGTHQIALWRRNKPIFSFTAQSRKEPLRQELT
jgi:hypothetical protein